MSEACVPRLSQHANAVLLCDADWTASRLNSEFNLAVDGQVLKV